ncbi:MAG TPA: DJ-1/PfpI family protein [Acidiferrobacterales bacterium]|nr:DJ-1/PfpI family protein [Acidiferrobacterales bacterium]
MDRKSVGIFIFPYVEVLDFAGPFEVFSVTRLNEERRREDPSPFDVKLIAERQEPVVATGGLKVIPDYTLSDCPPLDILVIPGGWGTRKEMNNEALLKWVQGRAATVDTLASVCTGSLVLGAAGLLDGKRATTHWRSLGLMREKFPSVHVLDDEHVVEEGRLFTSAGISAGIDMALKVVARYCGAAIARATARHMEYPYPDSNQRRIQIT